MGIEFEDVSEDAQGTLLKARLNEIRGLGKELPISREAAEELPTSILVMSVIKYPELIMEAGSLLQAAASEGQEALMEVQRTMNLLSENLSNCCQELDERLPPSRKQGNS